MKAAGLPRQVAEVHSQAAGVHNQSYDFEVHVVDFHIHVEVHNPVVEELVHSYCDLDVLVHVSVVQYELVLLDFFSRRDISILQSAILYCNPPNYLIDHANVLK